MHCKYAVSSSLSKYYLYSLMHDLIDEPTQGVIITNIIMIIIILLLLLIIMIIILLIMIIIIIMMIMIMIIIVIIMIIVILMTGSCTRRSQEFREFNPGTVWSVFKISCLFLRPRPWQFEI